MSGKQLVTVIIPCYNEAGRIQAVIRKFHRSGLAKTVFDFDILVVENASTDDTAEVAREAGARVITEPRKGKGLAMQTGFKNIDPKAQYVVMIDGDDTYRPLEVLRLLEPLHHDFCDVVVGSRLGGKMEDGSMSFSHRAGNWVFTHLARYVYQVNVTDVFSGYYAWKRDAIEQLAPHLRSHGFTLEMEMLTKMARMGLEVYSVPISFDQRTGQANLKAVQDGLRVLRMFISNLSWRHTPEPETQELDEEEA